MTFQYDAIVVGGGPSGSACATLLARAGSRVLLLDKSNFPRDKVCGDGVSGKCLRYLRELGVTDKLQLQSRPIHGILLSSPVGREAYLQPLDRTVKTHPGFVCRRMDFDDVLFRTASEVAETRTGFKVTDLVVENGAVKGVHASEKNGAKHTFTSKLVIGADGYTSIVAKKLGVLKHEDKHTAASVRAYYKGVTGLRDDIELHFIDGLFPGYFWIFPLPGKEGYANVGLGVGIDILKKRKLNLTQLLNDLIKNHPVLKERFSAATQEGPVGAWSLPLGSSLPKITFDGAMLIGDAARLVDPFAGEGIGNGLASASIAAEHLKPLLVKDETVMQSSIAGFEKHLKSYLGPELRASYYLQRAMRSRFLMNALVNRLNSSTVLQGYVASTIFNEAPTTVGLSPRMALNFILPFQI